MRKIWRILRWPACIWLGSIMGVLLAHGVELQMELAQHLIGLLQAAA